MIRGREKYPFVIIVLLLLVLVLSACQLALPTEGIPSSTPLQPTATETRSPTRTPTTPPTPSITPTTKTTRTPTPTNTPDLPNLSLTPLPQELTTITKRNLEQVDLLAVWGNGSSNQIALSGDSSLLAVGTDLGTFLYNSFDFRFVALLRSEEPVNAIAFSPDNELIALVEGFNRLVIYNQSYFKKITDISLPSRFLIEGMHLTLFFSPDSDSLTLLVKSTDEMMVFRWETESWDSAAQYAVQAGLGDFVNKSIGVLGVVTEGELILHSLLTPGVSRILPLPPNQGEVLRAVQSNIQLPIIPASNGDYYLLNQGNSIAYWDILDNKIGYKLQDYPYQETEPCDEIPKTCQNAEGGFSFDCSPTSANRSLPVQLIAITSDDQRMLISLNSGRTELRTTLSGDLIWEVDQGYTKAFFSLTDNFVLGLRPDGALEKRDLLDGKLLSTLKQHPSQFFDQDISPDGSILAAGFNDAWIRVFSTETGEMLGVLEGSAKSLKFSPDGGQLAAGLENGFVRIFELDRLRFFDLGTGHQGTVTGVAFSPDESRLTTSSRDCAIHRWDVKDRYRTEALIPFVENPIQILDIEKPAKDEMLYAAGEQAILAIDDERTTRLFSPPQGEAITDIVVTEDGQHLAASGSSIWYFVSDKTEWQNVPIQTPPSVDGAPFRVAFHAEAGLLLAVNEQTLTFYSFRGIQELIQLHQIALPPSMGQPVDVGLSPQGDLIAIGSENGLIHIFGIP